jgi:histidinol dehydrogenase
MFRFTGALRNLGVSDRARLLDRSTSSDKSVRSATAGIIARVRAEGDAALQSMAKEFDGVQPQSLEVPREERVKALEAIDRKVRRAMERAAKNIETVHRAELPTMIEVEPEPGIRIQRRADPLGRVGVYAPGGRAAYPSSVLMGAIPARVAGVAEVILCSPPTSSGIPSASVLAAAEIAGVSRVFAIGGAGAIAALAYGTKSVPRVDRIVGPGNAYVAEAKLQAAGVTGIDSPAGPSELLVIADDSVSADVIAREVLAQAEHDPMASVVVLTIGTVISRKILDEVSRLIGTADRREIIAASLRGRGALLVVDSIAEAVAFANDFAPEHLLLALADPGTAAASCRNAGTIFLGPTSSVAFGDYMTGANHVLPTGGLARSYSGLSVLDFLRWTTIQTVSASAAANLAEDAGNFAEVEGLHSHAATARQWAEARQ